MKKIKWQVRKIVFGLGYFYVVEDDKGNAYKLEDETYSSCYRAEAQEIADKLNEEEK